MILDLLGEAADLGIEARAFGHRPALEGIADLQPQVVVEAAGMVFLDDEDRIAGEGRAAGRRLRRPGEAPLGFVGVDAVGHEIAP